MRNPRSAESNGIPTGRELVVPVFRDLPGGTIPGSEMPDATHRFAMDRESTGGVLVLTYPCVLWATASTHTFMLRTQTLLPDLAYTTFMSKAVQETWPLQGSIFGEVHFVPGRSLWWPYELCTNWGHGLEGASKLRRDRALAPGRIDQIIYVDPARTQGICTEGVDALRPAFETEAFQLPPIYDLYDSRQLFDAAPVCFGELVIPQMTHAYSRSASEFDEYRVAASRLCRVPTPPTLLPSRAKYRALRGA